MNNCCMIINTYGSQERMQHICGRVVPHLELPPCDYYEKSITTDDCRFCVYGATCSCDNAIKDAMINRKLERL